MPLKKRLRQQSLLGAFQKGVPTLEIAQRRHMKVTCL
eukprot:CAMPEP_0177397734 /NCGR_PEP_ID=MMETSP0368-20130122/57491_1 /TAXON_ID=447022 ORGANISM="Scrippsiella hangoei-like, Strain SHHI-4" /NCGR_SAMPLE_ID=MMETSP0368 /ASSEMBLY_ACC=CAM_ASM_000363 /LENGTH=36 /DNA_ID= /DNA_START= /DNA_END= /DNA_ORIENTATION=